MFSWRVFWLKKRHSSELIGLAGVGILVGVAVSKIWPLWFSGFGWVGLAVVLLATSFIFKRTWLLVVIVAAGLLLGLWRGDQLLGKLQAYQPYFGKTVVLSGVVNEDVTQGKFGQLQAQLRDIKIKGESFPGLVFASVKSQQKLKRSDHILVDGTLKKPFGSFAANLSGGKVLKKIVGADAARDLRDRFARGVRKAVVEPQASLGIGYLVGQRSSLPATLDDQLRMVGLTHIVVASGYNLSILVRLARRLFSKISKYLTAVAGGGLIGSFILVTGFSPSMTRAGLVAGLSLAAWYYGRKISPFVLLPLVAASTVLINPTYVWGDAGWLLSFAAFAGVMILAPLLQDYFFGPKKPGFIRQVLGETIAATLATLPIIMVFFGHYSLYALPANLLVVPLIPYAMLLVFIAGLGGILAGSAAAAVVGFPAAGLLSYMTKVVHVIASWPGAYGEVSLGPTAIVIYYAAFILVGVLLWRKTKHNFLGDNIIE